MSLLFRFCGLEIYPAFCNSYKIWFYYQQVLRLFLCLRQKTPYSMALVETLSCQILELLKLFFSNVVSGSIPERFVPKGHCRAPSLLS